MKSLESFLNPKRKPNLRFKLGAFEEEFEMKLLSADEDTEISNIIKMNNESGTDISARYVAESLAVPDLHSKELLEALSEKTGKKILDPLTALKQIVNGAELATLIGIYYDYANVTVDFGKKVDEIKN